MLIFGAGDIARNTRRLVEPFGVTVTLVGSRSREGVLGPEDGRRMLGRSDMVVLAVPLEPGTRQLADAGFLAAMPDGAVLVNVGRGGLVDTEALLTELHRERLAAILDVTDPEPLPPDHPLWSAPGAVVSPHASALTEDLDDRCWTAIARRITDFVAADGR